MFKEKPIRGEKQKARKLNCADVFKKNNLLVKLKNYNFDHMDCKTSLWLRKKLPIGKKASSIELMQSLGNFFSIVLEVTFPREAYRRKKTAIYWLEEHFDTISMFCEQNVVQIEIGGNIYHLQSVTQTIPWEQSNKESSSDLIRDDDIAPDNEGSFALDLMGDDNLEDYTFLWF